MASVAKDSLDGWEGFARRFALAKAEALKALKRAAADAATATADARASSGAGELTEVLTVN